MSWHCIDCGTFRGHSYVAHPPNGEPCGCPGPRGLGSASVWREPTHDSMERQLETALEAVERARMVVKHWRAKADEADAEDADQTAKLPFGEDRPVVTYVPASGGLRLAANRLETALDGW